MSRTVSSAPTSNGSGNEHAKTAQGLSGAKIDNNDNTLLNKKVAFRMLKQLGYQVRRENEVSFVEVSLAKQPLLFKMLG